MSNPEISEAAKAKRDQLIRQEYERDPSNNAVAAVRFALARHIQTTSDVAKEINSNIERQRVSYGWCPDYLVPAQAGLESLILPEPKDPLEEVLKVVFSDLGLWTGREADELRNELAKRGGKITFD